MAIDRPEATDATPVRAEAERRTARHDFLASRGMGAAQGKKVVTRRCGLGGRGDSLPSAKSRNRRGRSEPATDENEVEGESDLAGFHKLQREGGSETQRECGRRVLVVKPAVNRRPNNAVEPQSPTRHREDCCRWRRNPDSHDQGLAHGGAFEMHPPLCFGIFAGVIGLRLGEAILVAGVVISYCVTQRAKVSASWPESPAGLPAHLAMTCLRLTAQSIVLFY